MPIRNDDKEVAEEFALLMRMSALMQSQAEKMARDANKLLDKNRRQRRRYAVSETADA
jgi:hypothetical protein